MKYLITGADGQLGMALKTKFKKIENEIFAYDIGSMDITDYSACYSVINSVLPDIIINCAAQTKVDLSDVEYEETYKINVLGAENIANIAKILNIKVIHISTDYVFDGKKLSPYNENDVPNPLNYYAKSKLESEEKILKCSKKNIVLRTAWMYGEGHNFINTILKLSKEKKNISIVNDQYGTPTSARAVADAVDFIINSDASGGIYHATCEGETSWYNFAKKIFELSGIKDVKLIPVSSSEYNSLAKRPQYSVLENKRLKNMGYIFPKWEDEVKKYIQKYK